MSRGGAFKMVSGGTNGEQKTRPLLQHNIHLSPSTYKISRNCRRASVILSALSLPIRHCGEMWPNLERLTPRVGVPVFMEDDVGRSPGRQKASPGSGSLANCYAAMHGEEWASILPA
jgi:hypothetical protein